MPIIRNYRQALMLNGRDVVDRFSKTKALITLWSSGLWGTKEIGLILNLPRQTVNGRLSRLRKEGTPLPRLKWWSLRQASLKLNLTINFLLSCHRDGFLEISFWQCQKKTKRLISDPELRRFQRAIPRKRCRCGKLFLAIGRQSQTCGAPHCQYHLKLQSRRYTQQLPFTEETCPVWAKKIFALAQVYSPDGETMMDVDEATERFDIWSMTIYRLIRRGILPAIHETGGRVTKAGRPPVLIPVSFLQMVDVARPRIPRRTNSTAL